MPLLSGRSPETPVDDRQTRDRAAPGPDADQSATESNLSGAAAALFLMAIFAGSALGLTAPAAGAALSAGVDPTLFAMIFLLLFELRLNAVLRAFANLRFLTLALGANFVIAPLIGFAIAALLLSDQSLLFTGLVIYFAAPCTDWFLGFTRMAGGDTTLGAALIPINLFMQLLLFPLWLWLFTSHDGLVDFAAVPGVLAQWFLLPLIGAQVFRFCLQRLLSESRFERLVSWVGHVVTLAIAGLILQIFAANIGAIVGRLELFGVVLVATFLFFMAIFFAGQSLSRLAGLPYPQHALLAMTMAARNAPLMLAVTAVALPDQPLILTVLVIGMLLEFPYLTGLKQVLLRRRSRWRNAAA